MGPLDGIRVIEMAGIGPGPFCGMLLADMGAEVVCIERNVPALLDPLTDCARRGKRSVLLDLKQDADREILLRLVEKADALFEGYRPGVMEKLRLGPAECRERNPRLVYGRITGWGQNGPLSQAAGHDINYIALTGALHATGPRDGTPAPPVPPMGDFGGGAMFLAFGLACALLEARRSGRGQVVDAAMTDGTALLMSLMYSLDAQGNWSLRRGHNLLDGGAPFYGVYETADGTYVALGAIEAPFFQEFLRRVGIDPREFGSQMDSSRWPAQRQRLEELFRQRTREEWCQLLEGSDACFAPVLDLREAPAHPHNRARGTYCKVGGAVQPSPAPRFDRSMPRTPSAPRPPGADTEAVLKDWGVD